MTLEEFTEHIPIIADERFEIDPIPVGIDRAHRFFKFEHNSDTHAEILNDKSELLYLPLAAIEFINPGKPPMLRTYRKMNLQNQSFV